MLDRTLKQSFLELSAKFPVVMVTGPRQVGKSTLLKDCANEESTPRRHVTLDDYNARDLAVNDPALFLQQYQAPVIIDEIQYAPGLLSAIKVDVDRHKQPGRYWLTASQKFTLMKGVTESLAGRVALLDLLGLSQAELTGRAQTSPPFVPSTAAATTKTVDNIYDRIWLGSFPRLNQLGPKSRDTFYRSYVQTYIERDVQNISRVNDHMTFHRFLCSVAASTGQLLNQAGVARDVGVDNKTIKSWLSILETSGLI